MHETVFLFCCTFFVIEFTWQNIYNVLSQNLKDVKKKNGMQRKDYEIYELNKIWKIKLICFHGQKNDNIKWL